MAKETEHEVSKQVEWEKEKELREEENIKIFRLD